MHNRLAPRSRPHDQLSFGDIAFDQLKPGVGHLQIGGFAGGQVIENPYRIAFCQQRIAQVRTDEAGATGDQNWGISHDDRIDPVRVANPSARRGV
ncbi:hypothetical protein D3C84_1028420 [compost metagenome]